MPKQEIFLEQKIGDRLIEVIKTYDQRYAREAFDSMDESALARLWTSLRPEELYEPSGLPKLNDPADVDGEAAAFLWDELVDQAREDGTLFSFFVVNEVEGARSASLYVSPDWPSAQQFAQSRLGIQADAALLRPFSPPTPAP